MFQIHVNLPAEVPKLTKSIVLSEIFRIFDPLGLLLPVTVRLKILMQSIWKHELSWDDELTDELQRQYLQYRAEMMDLRKFCDKALHDA